MAKTAGYWVELSGVKFDDNGTSSWIQALPEGTYEHPVYGEMVFDTPKIEEFASNINNNVRVAKLDIDYEHKAQNGEAAGWVEKAEARADGLWILVDWTKKAAQDIKDKVYRYFSPEIVDEWTNPKSGVTYKNLIFGGGITNRPFLRDIQPLNLSEIFANAGNQPTKQEGKSMNAKQLKALAERLGLADDISSDDLFKKLEETLDAKPEVEGEGDLEETDEEKALKQLSETNPVVKRLMDMVNVLGQSNKAITKQLAEEGVKATIAQLSESFIKKGIAIAPTALVSLQKTLMESPSKEFSEAVVATFTSIADAKVVQLGELGGTRRNKDGNTAVERFMAATKKFQEENKVDFATASSAVAAQDQQLFEEYQAESYSDDK